MNPSLGEDCGESFCTTNATEECYECGLPICEEHIAEYDGDVVCWSCCDALFAEEEEIND